MPYSQCWICREWSWDVTKAIGIGTELCLPCYVDCLEVKQERRERLGEGGKTEREQRPSGERPAKSVPPDPFPQIEMFD